MKNNVKRIMALFLCLVCLVGIVSCGGPMPETDIPKADDTPVEDITPLPPEAKPEEITAEEAYRLIYDEIIKYMSVSVEKNITYLSFEAGKSLSNEYYSFNFLSLENGNHAIQPRTAEIQNSVISVVNMSGSGYITISTQSPTLAENQWILVPINDSVVNRELYKVTTKVVYDEGYDNCYGDETDTRIKSHLVKTQNYYLGNFGIVFDFQYQYSTSMFESISDAQCSGVNCTHTAHTLLDICHSDVNMILNNTNWEEIKSNSDFVLVFIGHDLCRTKPIGEVQTHYDVGGVRSGDICLIEATASDYEFKTVIHELGHFLGALDHYGQNGFPGTKEVNKEGNEGFKYDTYCIYGENKTSAENGGNVMCAGCTYRINQYFN